ncbi:ester cyclase [Streptomyces sp. NBC_01340]|nr:MULTISPECIES: ester cyclase [unclassified Streptomyces]MCX4459813.1 ester cyclase [Streptomyces sp. NBC_01719]MCX4594913.1 ester cyclase [Streptomyces sp. NBC_01549]WSI43583.1 ester cyclase [Streptomyces sp. NBC_01340]
MDATDLAHGLFRVLETGDPALAAEVVHDDFHNREAAVSPTACSLPGPAGVLASGAWMRSAFSDLSFPVLGIARNDEQVWVRLRMQGRHTGAFVRFRDGALDQAIPPTGRDIDFEQIHVLDLRDGKVVGHEAVRDDITMLGQLGVFPPAPPVALRMLAWRVTGKATRAAADVTAKAAEAAGLNQSSPQQSR